MSYSQQRTQPPAGHRSLRRTFHDCEYSIILNLPWLFDTVFRDPSSPDACSSNSGGNLKGGEKRFSKLNFFENVGIYICTGEERNKQRVAWGNVEMRGRKEGRMEVEKRIDGREFVGLVRSQTIIFDCLIRFVMLELIDSFLRVQDSMFIGGFFSLGWIILYASDTRTCLR